MLQQADYAALHLVSIEVGGILFASGQAVSFPYMRNKESAEQFNIPRSLYQQDIEPAGRYMVLDELPGTPKLPGWEAGIMHLSSPLVLSFNGIAADGGYDAGSWKARLSVFFDGKVGEALSRAIAAAGFDGIVTVRGGNVSEIVDLTMWR